MQRHRTLLFRGIPTFLTACLFLSVSACDDAKVNVQVSIQTQSPEGEIIPEAKVEVNGIAIGKTDQNGQFQGEVDLKPASQAELKISKESSEYYFAPYFERFDVAKQGSQTVPVKAVLYFVEKPSIAEAQSIEEKETNDLEKREVALTENPVEPAQTQSESSEDIATEDGQTDVTESSEAEAEAQPDTVVQTEADEEAAPATVEKEEPQKPVLSRIPETPASQQAAFPERKHQNQGSTLFTVHLYTGKQPISEGLVYVGEPGKDQLKVACQTNDRGRCAIRFKTRPKGSLTFVAKKPGFATVTRTSSVKHQGTLRFDMKRGETIDIFAIRKVYNFTSGLNKAEVWIAGKKVGFTDRFGHFAYVYTGEKSALLDVAIKARNHLPETYETDFVVSGPMNLVRYFTPSEPPPVRLTLLDVQGAGRMPNQDLLNPKGELNENIRSAVRKELFASKSFEEFSFDAFHIQAKEAGKTYQDMIQDGWMSTDLKGDVEAVVRPTIVFGSKLNLEFSVVDSTGKVIAAAQEELKNLTDETAISQAVKILTAKISRVFPFEGAVTGKDGEQVITNLGFSAGRGVQVGDELEIFGVQSDKFGQKQLHQRIARLKVESVEDQTARGKVVDLEPRATISRGDLVVMGQRNFKKGRNTVVQVTGKVKGLKEFGVGQANVYFNGRWVGATEQSGRLFLSSEIAGGAGQLKVVKHGYREYSSKVSLTGKKQIQITLNREDAFLRIHSEPSNAKVSVDGKMIGTTPINSPYAVPSGFVKLEIQGPPGYKTYTSVMELDQGTLELTGANAVRLEEDLRSQALRLVDGGQLDQAIKMLAEIPESHSDYLLAQHERGELLLANRDDPAKAAEAFAQVTRNRNVEQFTDKRFIGSHINEGIALFMTGERLAETQPTAAQAHYEKAIEVLERVSPYLRFVAKDQFSQAAHNVGYYTGLAYHKLWSLSKQPQHLNLAYKAWQRYVDGTSKSLEIPKESESYLSNATVYYKQAQAELAAKQSEGADTAL